MPTTAACATLHAMPADWYWNRDNFEALGALAQALAAQPRLQGLADWCALRVQGHRKAAFAALEGLLQAARTWPPDHARGTVLTVLDLSRQFPEAHSFLSHPLRTRLIDPVLAAWRAAEPENPVPCCEQALLAPTAPALRAALEMLDTSPIPPPDPARSSPPETPTHTVYRERVTLRLASVLLDAVDHAGHHLSEGLFLGDEADALAHLTEAKALLAAAPPSSGRTHLTTEAEHQTALLADWLTFKALDPPQPRPHFPAWCAERGIHHRWWQVVYYDP